MKRTLAALAACLMSTVAHSGEFFSIPDTGAIVFSGSVDRDDAVKLEDILAQRDSHGHQTNALILNSPGGHIQPANRMAHIIRGRSLDTAVAQGEECSSACVLMFSAGITRYVSRGSLLGAIAHPQERRANPPVTRMATQRSTWLVRWHILVRQQILSVPWCSPNRARYVGSPLPRFRAR
ncbi:hypothetical protein DEV91_102312 [Phyllobacterium brassicacearum]|nr:hypothetical protein DEV91_102312 [Phyllobacterium brassicacearum]